MLIVCWDYDGTLVSSELIYKNIFVNYLSKNGYVIKNIDNEGLTMYNIVVILIIWNVS